MGSNWPGESGETVEPVRSLSGLLLRLRTGSTVSPDLPGRFDPIAGDGYLSGVWIKTRLTTSSDCNPNVCLVMRS